MSLLKIAFIFSLFLQVLLCVSGGEHVVPYDGMVITSDTLLAHGDYYLPHGISIGSSNIFLNLNNSTLRGDSNQNVGITLDGYSNVYIGNGKITNYYYGIKISNGRGNEIAGLELFANWQDPNAQNPTPPSLDINVTPEDYGDKKNLGGGMWVSNNNGIKLHHHYLHDQENGVDLFNVTDATITNNRFETHVGWCLHVWKSQGTSLNKNSFKNCVRRSSKDRDFSGNSAAVLITCGSSDSVIQSSTFVNSGSAFIISGFPTLKKDECCPSTSNIILQNKIDQAVRGAFEDSFSNQNQYLSNNITNVGYGFLGMYLSGNTIIGGNRITNATHQGIILGHSNNNKIVGNIIKNTTLGNQIELWTDLKEHYNPLSYQCLQLKNQQNSSNNEIISNIFEANSNFAINLINTTQSLIYNNYINLLKKAKSIKEEGLSFGNQWYTAKQNFPNICNGENTGGNYYSDYTGKERWQKDGFGDTPYNDNNLINEYDKLPLICKKKLNSIEREMDFKFTSLFLKKYLKTFKLSKFLTK
ncbi:hypothetical protein M0812_09896 [Anaeramoeba flamelloides]|uniref:Periplasmic copper-binding protein NosD beta helix domain-containing protein n=1 Tax=Anaeramoeba flamelloides TaxID=1746091 RepID=A0AAV7ZPW1_9EUKA|nr:hypothetical protein M0812_09896 [Anaeramoeba flamelloides]